jgi:hypothetical protein
VRPLRRAPRPEVVAALVDERPDLLEAVVVVVGHPEPVCVVGEVGELLVGVEGDLVDLRPTSRLTNTNGMVPSSAILTRPAQSGRTALNTIPAL